MLPLKQIQKRKLLAIANSLQKKKKLLYMARQKNKKRKNHHSRYRRLPTTTHSPTTATATTHPLSCTDHCATMDILVLSKSFITITITKSHSFHFIQLHIFYLRILLKSIHLIFIRLAIRLSHR